MNSYCVKKLANALMPNAKPAKLIRGPTLWGIKLAEKYVGGLWVGGDVTLSNEGISFKANRLNASLHVGLEPVSISRESILSIERISSWGMDIVCVKHSDGEFRFRCYGATELVNEFKENVLRF
jgi:hypothetical protein